MDPDFLSNETKWRLPLPSSLTEEELLLKSKYEQLKKLKQKLHLYKLTGKSSSSDDLKNKSKIRSVSPKDINSKKTCDFKKSTRNRAEGNAERSRPVHFFDDSEPRSIHVEGQDLNDQFLQASFTKYGYIWKIRTNENMTRSVLTFKNPSSAKSAAENLNGATIDGVKLKVSLPKPKNTSWCSTDKHLNDISDIRNKGISVYLSYDGHITPTDVENFFQGVGKIRRFYLNEMKGFGFVTFETEEQAKRAIREMNGQYCSGVRVMVSPQKFVDRDIKKASSSGTREERQEVSFEDLEM